MRPGTNQDVPRHIRGIGLRSEQGVSIQHACVCLLGWSKRIPSGLLNTYHNSDCFTVRRDIETCTAVRCRVPGRT